jgi:hypothetical protein
VWIYPVKLLRFFIFGANIAALMPRSGPSNRYKGRFIITPQVLRKLKPETRKLVHKFTSPVVYILE